MILDGEDVVSPYLVFRDPFVDAFCRDPNRSHHPYDRKSALRDKALDSAFAHAEPLGGLVKAPEKLLFGVGGCGLVGRVGWI